MVSCPSPGVKVFLFAFCFFPIHFFLPPAAVGLLCLESDRTWCSFSSRVTNSSWFFWDCPGFSSESPASWEMLQSQKTGSVGHPLSQWLKDFIPQGKKFRWGFVPFLQWWLLPCSRTAQVRKHFSSFLSYPNLSHNHLVRYIKKSLLLGANFSCVCSFWVFSMFMLAHTAFSNSLKI